MTRLSTAHVTGWALAGLTTALLSGCAMPAGEPTGSAASIRGAALMNVAKHTATSGDDATAISLYREAHRQNPHDPAPLMGMGRALFRLGAYEQAAEVYRQAIHMRGVEADARRGLGNALIALDRPALALQQLVASLELKKDAGTYNGLGVAYDMKGEHAHAQAMYRMGLVLKPNDLALRNNLGLSFAASGAYREAIDVLSKAAASTDAGQRERNNLALAYGLAGDTASAARIAHRDMDEAAVQKNLAMYAALRARNLGQLPVSGKHAAAPEASAPKRVAEAKPSTAAPATKTHKSMNMAAATPVSARPPHKPKAASAAAARPEPTKAVTAKPEPVWHAASPTLLVAEYDYPAVEGDDGVAAAAPAKTGGPKLPPAGLKPGKAVSETAPRPEPTDVALADAPVPGPDVKKTGPALAKAAAAKPEPAWHAANPALLAAEYDYPAVEGDATAAATPPPAGPKPGKAMSEAAPQAEPTDVAVADAPVPGPDVKKTGPAPAKAAAAKPEPVWHVANPALLVAEYDYPAVEGGDGVAAAAPARPGGPKLPPAGPKPGKAVSEAPPQAEPTDVALAEAPVLGPDPKKTGPAPAKAAAPKLEPAWHAATPVLLAAEYDYPTVTAHDGGTSTAPQPAGPEAKPDAAATPQAAPSAGAGPTIKPLGAAVAFRPAALPEPASFTAQPLHGTYYRAHLAEFPSRSDATKGWLAMVQRAPELYGAVEIIAERTALTTTRLRYTLVTPPVANRAPVEKMCAALESRGFVCHVEPAASDQALSPRG